MAVEDSLRRWSSEIGKVLDENIDIKDEVWFKSLQTANILINKSLLHLEDKND